MPERREFWFHLARGPLASSASTDLQRLGSTSPDGPRLARCPKAASASPNNRTPLPHDDRHRVRQDVQVKPRHRGPCPAPLQESTVRARRDGRFRPFQEWQELNSVVGAYFLAYSVVGAAFSPQVRNQTRTYDNHYVPRGDSCTLQWQTSGHHAFRSPQGRRSTPPPNTPPAKAGWDAPTC